MDTTSVALVCVLLCHLGHCKAQGENEDKLGPEPNFDLRQIPLTSVTVEDKPPRVDIFPPKYFPGDVIDSIETRTVDEALNDVMRAGDVMHDRRCALSISNEGSHLLVNPRWYLSSGGIHSAPGVRLPDQHSGLNLFLKTPWAARGSVGVLSYDINGTDYKLAVMWHVPFDRNLYDNYFNMKIYPATFSTNDDMFDQMYENAGPWKSQGWQERTEFGIHMLGTMTDNTESKVMVWINTANFQPEGEPSKHAGCSYHPGKVRKYCWRECYPEGWCWVDKKCSSDDECRDGTLDSLPCDSGC